LPLAPGSYLVEVTLTNRLNLEAERVRSQVVVPEVKATGLGVSQLLVYKQAIAETNAGGTEPFVLTSFRFTPRALGTVSVHAGDAVPLVFQLWLPKLGEAKALPKTVHLHYLCGSVAAGGKAAWEFDEDVETSNADAAGNLVTGHTVPTSDLVPGSYRLVVKATAEGDPTPAFSTLTLRVVPQETRVDGWTAFGPEQSANDSADDLKRGLAAEAFGRKAEAEGFYASELKTNPGQLRALVRLVALLSAEGKTAELAKLSDAPLLASAVPPETLLSIAGAVRDSGDLKKAIRMVTAQLDLQAPSAPMYELLASLYETAGDGGKASDARTQAKRLKPATVAPPAQSR
jgi:hypothetical protein